MDHVYLPYHSTDKDIIYKGVRSKPATLISLNYCIIFLFDHLEYSTAPVQSTVHMEVKETFQIFKCLPKILQITHHCNYSRSKHFNMSFQSR